MKEIYLVRHGEYDHRTLKLNEKGRQQSEEARDKFIGMLVGGSSVIILSSDAPRAADTANIIGQGLETLVHLSERLNKGGNDEWLVGNLDDFLEDCLTDLEVEASQDSTLIAVAHAPLIKAVFGLGSVSSVRHAGIYKYEPTWINPRFNPEAATKEFETLNQSRHSGK